jgi:hypothetical protein
MRENEDPCKPRHPVSNHDIVPGQKHQDMRMAGQEGVQIMCIICTPDQLNVWSVWSVR